MTVYKIVIDGKDEGTIHSVSLGHAAREAMINLEVDECNSLEVTNTHLDVTTMYKGASLVNGSLYYNAQQDKGA